MKKIFLLVITAFSVMLFAQENELKTAKNQLDTKNFQDAIRTTEKLEQNYPFEEVDPKTMVEMYNIRGNAYLGLNDISNAALAFTSVTQMEENPVYWVKNKNDKTKHYFLDKSKAEAYASSVDGSVKEMILEKLYSPLNFATLNSKLGPASEQANKYYNAKNFKEAAKKFKETYHLMNAMQREGEPYLYYAAISAYQAEDFDAALPLFQEIINIGYEGDDPDDNALETSYRLVTFVYTQKEDWENVQKYAKMGLDKFPKNEDLKNAQTQSISKSGNDEAFIAQLKKNITNNPEDSNSLYNLGVMYTKQENGLDTAFDYFSKALQYDAGNQDIYENILYVISNQAKDLQGSANEDAEKKRIYSKLVPIMEQARMQFPQEVRYVTALKLAYRELEDYENYDKYSTIEKSFN